MNLLTVYTHMLKQAGLEAELADGTVSSILTGKKTPAMIKLDNEDEPKRLILPTPEQLKVAGWDNRVAFHPLKEDIFTGESPVVRYLRIRTLARMNLIIKNIFKETLDLAVSTGTSSDKLNPNLIKLLNTCKDANKNVIDKFKTLTNKVGITSPDGFIHIYLKKNHGNESGLNYSCLAVISFPLYEKLKEIEHVKADDRYIRIEDNTIAFTQKEVSIFLSLYRYIFPDIDDKEKYKIPVGGSIVPFTEALVRATEKVGELLNKITKVIFKGEILEFNKFTNDHVKYIYDTDKIIGEIKLIPALPGNKEPVKKTKDAVELPTLTQENIPPWEDSNGGSSAGNVPIIEDVKPAKPTKSAAKDSGAITLKDIPMFATPTPQAQPQPVRQGLPMGYPQQPMYPPVYPQQAGPLTRQGYVHPQQGMVGGYPQPMQGMYPQQQMMQGYPQGQQAYPPGQTQYPPQGYPAKRRI